MGISIIVVMECKPQNGDRKTKKEYQAKFFIHRAEHNPPGMPAFLTFACSYHNVTNSG